MARIAVVPIVGYLMTFPGKAGCIAAMILFVAASLSDIADGVLARRMGVQSTLGAFLDPLADKLLVTTALIMLIPLGRAPAWLVTLLLCRELAVTGLRTIALSEGLVIAASPWGKFKTAYLSTALGFLIFHYPVPFVGADAHSVGLMLLWVGAIASVVSAVDYLSAFLQIAMVPAHPAPVPGGEAQEGSATS